MSGFLTLLSLSLIMGIASFLPGLLPISLSMSPAQSRIVTTIGAGSLVGTSLIIVIPEGVDSLYNSQLPGSQHNNEASTGSRRTVALRHRQARQEPSSAKLYAQESPKQDQWRGVLMQRNIAGPGVSIGNERDQQNAEEDESGRVEGSDRSDSPHVWIGIALISGFVLMFIIEKLSLHVRPTKSTDHPYHIALDELGRGPAREQASSDYGETDEVLPVVTATVGQSRSFATTAGLVIHAAADGIALGASSSVDNSSVSFIIFVAIMVHKAPTAFGLSSVLLKQGLSKRTARAHLLLFSLAAPIGAVLTWLIAHSIGAGSVNNTQDIQWWTAMLLLFSAGTFLYVAMHTMQEVGDSDRGQLDENLDAVSEGRNATAGQFDSSRKDTIFTIIGMALPLFLQIGHAH